MIKENIDRFYILFFIFSLRMGEGEKLNITMFSQERFKKASMKWDIFKNALEQRFPDITYISRNEEQVVVENGTEKEYLIPDDIYHSIDAHVYLGNSNAFNLQTKTWANDSSFVIYLKVFNRDPQTVRLKYGYYYSPANGFLYPDFGNADYYMFLNESTNNVYFYDCNILKRMLLNEDVWQSGKLLQMSGSSKWTLRFDCHVFATLYDMYSHNINFGNQINISAYRLPENVEVPLEYQAS